MKNLFLAIALIIGVNISAQERSDRAVFVRVYDLEGKKISKGKIISISDTSLYLRGKKESHIEAKRIGVIKTKRSGGNNVLIGAASGAALFAIAGAASAEPDALFFGYNAAEGAAAGALLGGAGGAAIGGFTTLFKDSQSFYINGDELRFKEFKDGIGTLKQRSSP